MGETRDYIENAATMTKREYDYIGSFGGNHNMNPNPIFTRKEKWLIKETKILECNHECAGHDPIEKAPQGEAIYTYSLFRVGVVFKIELELPMLNIRDFKRGRILLNRDAILWEGDSSNISARILTAKLGEPTKDSSIGLNMQGMADIAFQLIYNHAFYSDVEISITTFWQQLEFSPVG